MIRRTRVPLLVLCLLGTGCGATAAPSSTPSGVPATATTSSESPAAAPATSPSSAAPGSSVAKVAIGAECVKKPMKFDGAKIDLTGSWLGDDDGIYYIRQIGTAVWWNGMAGRALRADQLGRDWNNVAMGELKPNLTVALQWADTPRGEIRGYGTLLWKVSSDPSGNVKFTKVAETGTGFGGAEFWPCAPG